MDLGSNSFKMTVAQWDPELNARKPFRILHKERHPIQLGSSVFSEGKISAKNFKEAIRALKKMQERLRDFSSPILRCVATSAIRDSSNGRQFVERVKVELGLPIEVISGEQEAALIAHGLTWEYNRVRKGLLIDIGGGSTEIASFGLAAGSAKGQSLRVGSVRVAMKHFKDKNRIDLSKVRSSIRGLLLKRPIGPFEKVVGSAGTIQALGQILSSGRTSKSIRLIELDVFILQHLRSSSDALQKKFRVQPSRARVLVPGAIVLSEIMHWLKVREISVTGMSLRDGLLVDIVDQWKSRQKAHFDLGVGEPKSVLQRSMAEHLEAIAKRFHCDIAHGRHVAALADSLYRQLLTGPLRSVHHQEERRYLAAASVLHDIGKIVSESAHQKHSAYLLRHIKLPGFTMLESKKIALIALFHRKVVPPKKDPLPMGVSGVHADQVRRLVAILRIADGLDEFEIRNVRAIKIRVAGKQAALELSQINPDSGDLGYFREKAAYFEELFGITLTTFVNHRRQDA